ncbi:MAG: DUF45 domain-containing protein [Lachnospiraceae bacterium]|nr:DUF45 domain-containing protein [Lachnospiraceae bacterium]
MRVDLKDTATILRGAEIGSTEVSVSDSGEYKYIVLDIKKVDDMGCFVHEDDDCIRTNNIVDSGYITAKGDVIAGISKEDAVFVVGEAEEGYIIPSDCVVFRTNANQLLPEYLCKEITCYKAGGGTSFLPAGAEDRFWMNFDKFGEEDDAEELHGDCFDSYFCGKIDLPALDEQEKEGESVRKCLKERAMAYIMNGTLNESPTKKKDIYYEILGEIYDFEVRKSEEESVDIENDSAIVVRTNHVTNKRRVEKLLSDWYRAWCEEIVGEVLEKYKDAINKYSVAFPEYEIMTMDDKLIRYFPKENKLIIDPMLFTAPREYVEYVIIEHFIRCSHRGDLLSFAEIMHEIMPGWLEYAILLNDTMNSVYCIKIVPA